MIMPLAAIGGQRLYEEEERMMTMMKNGEWHMRRNKEEKPMTVTNDNYKTARQE